MNFDLVTALVWSMLAVVCVLGGVAFAAVCLWLLLTSNSEESS